VSVAVLGVLLMLLPAGALVGSLVALASGGSAPLLLPSLLIYGMMAGIHVDMCRHAKVSWGYAFLMPLAYTILIAALLGASWNLMTGRGVQWKGRRIRVEKQSTQCVESSFIHN
jgi:hypothetical protein